MARSGSALVNKLSAQSELSNDGSEEREERAITVERDDEPELPESTEDGRYSENMPWIKV